MNWPGSISTSIFQEPSASVAITHDSQWSILFEKVRCRACFIIQDLSPAYKGALKPEGFGHDGRLEQIVSENHRIISQEGRPLLHSFRTQLIWSKVLHACKLSGKSFTFICALVES